MISRFTKLHLYNCVRPEMMYASKLWIMTKQMEEKLGIWERRKMQRFRGFFEAQLWMTGCCCDRCEEIGSVRLEMQNEGHKKKGSYCE